ncbi:MMPL family transporter [Lentzea sp. NBRC 102530]|uniref:MMPL family transporter n=1 Tax=Lentzea sp. NBRC 102530 TaxID=3032201 RepID=UPI0024A2C943|nr:MMPL family transporter [Lentzea sp. NBRC 102530]GLY51087.1 RND transporter [Lentzea sp. NBRC 102530]
MFAKWGTLAYKRRWVVMVATLALTVMGGVWGLGVFERLNEGGFGDPTSESIRANKLVEETFGRQGGDIVIIYTAPTGSTIDSPDVREKAERQLAGLPTDKVKTVASYWSLPQPNPFGTADKSKALVAITLQAADSNTQLKDYAAIHDQLVIDGVPALFAGQIPVQKAIAEMSGSDLVRAETVSMPLVLLLLVIVFGGLVAASLPVIVGMLSIMGALGLLHAISLGTDVNSFAINVATLLGLGMAIDYGLFIVGRFREELAAGRTPEQAVQRTVSSAGRTVIFSATLLVTALAGLLLFPQAFLKSLGYGGMSAVVVAAVVSLTLLPALLGILGHRVDKFSMPWRKRMARSEHGSGWARLGTKVMKRPGLFAIPIVAVLLALGLPFLHAKFGEATEKVLPVGNESRVAVETLNDAFPAIAKTGIDIAITGDPGQEALQSYLQRVADVPGVDTAEATLGPKDGRWLVSATLTGEPLSDESKQAVADVRKLAGPQGADQVLVGGPTAVNVDSLDAISDKLPWMALLFFAATFILMFLAFGSVLLPIKAIVMSALSLSATFGVLVWIFQDGHLASLFGVTPSPLDSGIVVLMVAVILGLSTDYEVFLLSRMVEAKSKGASNEEAVGIGLAKTGRVITAAAILLIVVTGAFAFSQVAMMRFVGVGMILALALDATIVRMLLVPAVLKLMGDAAWWAPGPLRRIQEKLAIHEGGDVDDDDDDHAAPRQSVPQPVG